ncbi:MAG: MFS transporter [Synergistetes bacterium]|nr:MFS transporter [Synergistota bacterium]MCX8128203.1 MFS transporter [Synergistota bacterium]MDW8192650.1 MFS transporter [Synergistota bacterium]
MRVISYSVGWKKPFLISLISTLMLNSYLGMFLVYPIYLKIVGIDSIKIGFLMGLFYVANMAIRPIGSMVLERLSMKKASFLAFFFLFISAIGLIFSLSPKIIALWRLLGGLGYGIGTVSLTAYQSIIVPERIRGSSFAWISVCYVSPQLLFVPIASHFIKIGHYMAYLSMFLIFSVLFILASQFLNEIKDINLEECNSYNNNAPSWGTYRELLKTKGIFTYIISILTFSIINGTILMYATTLLYEKGLHPSLFLSINASVAMIIRIVGNRMLNQLNRYRWLGLSLLIMIFSTFLMGHSSKSVHFILLSITYGSGMAISFPFLLAIASDITVLSLRPKASALAWLTMDFGYVLSPIIIGITSHVKDISFSFKILSIFCLPTALLISYLWKQFLTEKRLNETIRP